MKKVNKKTKKSKKSNDGFYRVICNRAYIVGESKKSVLFAGYQKSNTYTTWFPKKLVFKNEYALTVTISIPKDWETYSFSDIDGNEFEADSLKEYMTKFNWKFKKKFAGSEPDEDEEDEEDEDEEE